jgi:hypothetical protein
MLDRLRRCAGSGFRHGRANQELNLVVFGKQVEAIGVPTGTDVQVDVVAEAACGHHRILLVLLGELGESVVVLGVDDGALFDPANFVSSGLYAEKPAAMLENFEGFAVCDHTNAIGDGGNAVVKVHLPCGDIDSLVLLVAQAIATGEAEDERGGDEKCGESRHRVPE